MSAVTVVITGATGKLGRVLVADRLRRGDTVFALGSRATTAAGLSEEHGDAAKSRQLHVAYLDLTAPDAAQSMCSQLQQLDLLPTALVHAARDVSRLRASASGAVARNDFASELTLNVIASYELTMALATLVGSRLASVVNIGSQYGVVAPNASLYDDFPQQSFIHYGVAKAALVHLSRELAVRLAPRIRVNCVSFGGVDGRADPAFVARYAQMVPAGRMLADNEIAGPVEFLLSEASSGMTGHNLVVDGGWTAW
jgi:NAD(P)-dependent dehydrogenase (short-subunit alcohol dehydrogenase family)